MKKLILVGALMLAVAGCAPANNDPAPKATQEEIQPQQEPTPSPGPEVPSIKIRLPEGYPQVVDLATLPDNMRWAFENDGSGQAVAVAEGVWAHLTPGATVEDAVNSMVFDGYCASKEAFEREYLDGDSTPGMCW